MGFGGSMLHIGCHLSPSDGLLNMAKTASSLGADTFQFFSRNPRGSKAKPLDETDAAAMRAYLVENSFAPVLVHAPYTLNPCAEKPETAQFAELCMRDDLVRCTAMKTPFSPTRRTATRSCSTAMTASLNTNSRSKATR